MIRPGLSCVLVIAAALISGALLGCENVQDLGSHAPATKGGIGSGIDGGIVPPSGSGRDAKIFFVTDGLFSGDLGGLSGADAICTAEARAAGLSGAFKAWLSSSRENAGARIAPVGPWEMVEGTIVFDGPAVTGLPRAFLQYSAKQTDLFFSLDDQVWTGTNVNGTLNADGNTCADWTTGLTNARGSYGLLISVQYWTDSLSLSQTSESSLCTARKRLYCFEQ